MLKLEKIRAKSLLFLISGILVVSISFIFVNCGSGPMLKVSDTNKGAYAIDFSQAPTGGVGVLYVVSSALPDLTNKSLTIEAWIKRNTAETFEGTIFARFDTDPTSGSERGVIMYVKDNKPYFGINPSATSTFPVVSGDAMSNNIWYHIAGVLVNEVHSHPSSTTSAACEDAADERPHIDIYVNGQLKNCATTSSQFARNPSTSSQLSMGKFDSSVIIDTITSSTRFNGVIDEVRFWTVARTASEISQCYNKELGFTSSCMIDPSILKGYWRLNEGTGSSINDASGNGYSGSKRQVVGRTDTEWDGGWVAGYPF